jgi:hypothetical protein
LERHQSIGPFRFFKALIADHSDGNDYYLFLLKLPFCKYAYQIHADEYLWSQAVLSWHGKEGFRVLWWHVPEDNFGKIP